jgi:hypothetical protein
MIMIVHKTISMAGPVIPIIYLLQNIEQHLSVFIVFENRSLRIPSGRDMINSLSIFDPQRSRHTILLPYFISNVKIKDLTPCCIDVIVHPHLHQTLKQANTGDAPGASVADALKLWLRKSIRGNLSKAGFSSHPADQFRAKMLQDFINGQSDGIPAVIGIQILYPWLKSNIDLNRVDPQSGRLVHRYVADPANVAYIVAYRENNGNVKRDRPLTLEWRQSGAVIPNVKLFGEVPDGPLKGRALGGKAIDQSTWKAALQQYLSRAGIAEYAFVSKGNVVVYEDDSELYIRNFARSSCGFRKSWFKGIKAVRPSPLTQRMIPNVTLEKL